MVKQNEAGKALTSEATTAPRVWFLPSRSFQTTGGLIKIGGQLEYRDLGLRRGSAQNALAERVQSPNSGRWGNSQENPFPENSF